MVISRGSPKFLDVLVDACNEKLKSFLGERIASVFGVRHEFIKLENKLKYIKSMLNDAKRRRIDDSVTRTWIDELIDVMHDADDIIDDYRSEFEKHSADRASTPSMLDQIVSKLNFQSWFPIHYSGFAINDRIIALNKKIEEINQNKQAYSINMYQVQSSTTTNSRQTSSIVDSDIVGKEIRNSTKKIVEVVTRNHEGRRLCIVAIVGMGGIGKTTLAQNVYNDPVLMNNFQEKIWACVSEDYSATELLHSITKNIQPITSKAETISELHEQLASKIKGKRFFLVLDDVWQSTVYTDLLKNPLQFAASGVILLTTRDKTVASKVGAIYVHEVEKLSRRSCWELLCKKAHIEEEEDMLNLREVGIGIVKKCDGLPLAVKVIGGLLADKNKDKREWEKVLQSNVWFSSEFSEELYRALMISFNDLSPPLQNCFLFCSLFREDFIMLREDLVRDWISEGFIQQNGDEFLEETGEEYYNQLVRRNLLQPCRFLLDIVRLIDFERQCQMHDLIRTFAHHLGKGDNYSGNPELLSEDSVRTLRRLSITHEGDVAIVPGKKSDPLRLRTLILTWSPPIVQDDLFPRIMNIRTLVLNGTGIKSIPDSIGDLKHLRILDYDHTSISMLPNSICSLVSLQFLHLENCKSLKVLPQGITKLSNLKCLGLRDTPLISVPVGICRLKRLNELKGFIVTSEQYSDEMHNGWQLDELEPLTHLRCLRIDKLENAAIPGEILADKCHLRTLHFSCTLPERGFGQFPSEEDYQNIEITFDKLKPPQCLEYLTIWNFFGRHIPSWLENLPYLTWLILVDCVSCHQLPPLGELQSLKCLRIIGAHSVVSIGPEFLGKSLNQGMHMLACFPKLEFLRIENMPNLEEWSFNIDQVPERFFPILRQIDIVNCPKLKSLPEELKHINSIEEMFIREVQGWNEFKNFTPPLKWVYINNSSCVKISNLPRVQHLILVDCSALRCVENLDSLQSLYLEDESMDRLPGWLPDLLDQRPSIDDMELTLLCNMVTLRTCLLGGPDWPIIRRLSHVRAFNKDNTAVLEYQKQPYRYHTNL